MTKPTLKSLAAELGVDSSLVSRVLRGKPEGRVSEAKRALILDVASQRGYRPDRLGRSLRAGTSRIVAMLTPDITNPFHSLLFKGAEAAAQEAGYNVILCHAGDAPAGGRDIIGPLTQGLADALLVACSWRGDDRLAQIRQSQIPYVLVNRPSGEALDDWFGPDDYRTGAAGAEHLHARGHMRVAIFLGSNKLGSMCDRHEGFVDAYRTLNPDAIVEAFPDLPDERAARLALRKVLTRPPTTRPTGLFVPHSVYAGIALDVTLTARLRIPEDVSILGYGGSVEGAITSLVVPAEEMGRDAMTFMLQRLADGAADRPAQRVHRVYMPVLHDAWSSGFAHSRPGRRGADRPSGQSHAP